MKRTAASILWFLAIWVGYEVAWSVFEIPRAIGPVLGLAAALIVLTFPIRQTWAGTATGAPRDDPSRTGNPIATG